MFTESALCNAGQKKNPVRKNKFDSFSWPIDLNLQIQCIHYLFKALKESSQNNHWKTIQIWDWIAKEEEVIVYYQMTCSSYHP